LSRNEEVAVVKLHDNGMWPAQVRGRITGRVYDFSQPCPVQIVDWRDAPALMRSRFFRQVPWR